MKKKEPKTRVCLECKKRKPIKRFTRLDVGIGLPESDFSVCNKCVHWE